MRFHNRYRLSFNLCSNCSIVTPSAPAAPPFLFTFNHASHTRCLGMSCVLPCNFGSLMRFLPHRLITLVHLDDPAPSLPSPLRYAGGSQLLRASPPARPASVLSPSRIPPLKTTVINQRPSWWFGASSARRIRRAKQPPSLVQHRSPRDRQLLPSLPRFLRSCSQGPPANAHYRLTTTPSSSPWVAVNTRS